MSHEEEESLLELTRLLSPRLFTRKKTGGTYISPVPKRPCGVFHARFDRKICLRFQLMAGLDRVYVTVHLHYKPNYFEPFTRATINFQSANLFLVIQDSRSISPLTAYYQ